jgi:hypothetical protein
MAEMNVWQKLDKAEQSLKTGDFGGLKEASVISGEGQYQFMATLAERMQSSKASLPDLQIVDVDKDGSPERISAKGLTILKEGKGLAVETTSTTAKFGEKLASGWKALKEAVSEASPTTKVGDALNRANTTDSEMNRRWNRQMKEAGI